MQFATPDQMASFLDIFYRAAALRDIKRKTPNSSKTKKILLVHNGRKNRKMRRFFRS